MFKTIALRISKGISRRAVLPRIFVPAAVVALCPLGCIYHVGFGGGTITKTEDKYIFTASSERDPGIAIFPEDMDVDNPNMIKRSYLRFYIKGWTRNEGNYALLVVQIFNSNDSPCAPSIQKQITLNPNPNAYREEVIPLDGKIYDLNRVQFLLITERGSCEVYIYNMWFQ